MEYREWDRATGRFQQGGQTSMRLRATRQVRPGWGQGGEEGTLIATHPQQEGGGAQRGRRDTDSVGRGGGVRRNAPLWSAVLELVLAGPTDCAPGSAPGPVHTWRGWGAVGKGSWAVSGLCCAAENWRGGGSLQ